MILPSDTDVAVSFDACWISDIVQLKLGLESQGRTQSQVSKRAIFLSGAFTTGGYLSLLLFSHQNTFFRALLSILTHYKGFGLKQRSKGTRTE